MSTADAVSREVAWLTRTGDGLPTLLSSAGGPWNIVQGYRARTPPTRQTAIYLLRTSIEERRFSNQRKIQSYGFRANLWWPIGASSTGVDIWETESAALDSAVDLLLGRIRGFLADHTHETFLSVAEVPDRINVQFEDPERTATQTPAVLLATVTYSADDRDFTA